MMRALLLQLEKLSSFRTLAVHGRAAIRHEVIQSSLRLFWVSKIPGLQHFTFVS